MKNLNSIIETSKAAADALAICQTDTMQRMLNVERQIKWCSYYLYGTDISYTNGSNPADPRKLALLSISDQCQDINKGFCVTYTDFANLYHPEFVFLYPKPIENTNNYVLNATTIQDCVTMINSNKLLFESNRKNLLYNQNKYSQSELDDYAMTSDIAKNIATIIAGLEYYGKMDAFNDYLMETGHNNIKEFIKIYFLTDFNGKNYQEIIKSKQQLIYLFDGITSEHFKQMGGMYYTKVSYIPTKLQEQYNELQEDYKIQLDRIMKILENQKELTLCWSKASTNNVSMKNVKDSAINVNATAVVNCLSEAVVDGAMNGADFTNVQEKTLKIAIERLEKNNLEYYYELEEQLVKQQQKQTTTIIIISVVVLIIIIFIVMLFGIIILRKFKQIKNINNTINY
jgi:hypothetical protein